jgi:putative two-component system response regulator
METMRHILVIDDQAENRLIIEDLLAGDYVVHAMPDGVAALEALAAGTSADLILLDVVMPGLDGFEVCRRLKADPVTREVPVLFLTSLESAADETEGFAAGGEDFIHKPFSSSVVLARIRTHLQLAAARRELELRNKNLERLVDERTHALLTRNQEVIQAQSATITAFCALAEARDNETGNHIRRTQNYVRVLAERLRDHPRFRAALSNEAILLLYKSAPLHDIGKVAIPDAILNKPGKLTEAEWVVMRRHTEFGRDAIGQAENDLGNAVSFLRYAREIAYGHHEKWDGSGYPQGLAGEAIPLSARLMAAADVYDALISKRCYKPAFSYEQAIAIIAEGRGTHFDPAVAEALLASADEFRDVALRFEDAWQQEPQ